MKPINTLDRRKFLTQATGAVTLPLILNGIPLKAFDGPVLHDLLNVDEETDRVLVLVQLSGGNDGLNTIVPIDQYGEYINLRENIAIAENKVLPINSAMGFHPAMTGMKTLWDDKKIGIFHGVSYPNPNQSHFRATDIWMSGSASNVVESTGWIGRYLNTQNPGYPNNYPNTTSPDPLAIQMSATVGLSLVGLDHQSMGVALQDPESFFRLINGTAESDTNLPNSIAAKDRINYVRNVQAQSMAYSSVIKTAADKVKNTQAYPAINKLAQQLAIVARLIAGGLKTRVYVVTLGGFDTHAGQTTEGENETGVHATLLRYVSDAMDLFQKDIEALKVADRVLTMTFSEFGRRAASNVSNGTDHGTAAPMFIMGTPVIDGVRGTNPSLTDLVDGNLKMQHDFRSIYASVLQQWFGADPTLVNGVLMGEFATLPVVESSPTSVSTSSRGNGVVLEVPSPNPVRNGTVAIKYRLESEQKVRIELFDNLGFFVAQIVNSLQGAGQYTISHELSSLPSGTYFIQLRTEKTRLTQPIVIVR